MLRHIARSCTVQNEPQVIGRALRTNPERSATNTNFLFINRHISRIHAAIYKKDGAFYIKDTGSTFGTVLNDVLIAVEEPHVLKTGDVVGLVVNRPASIVKSWRENTLLPENIPLEKILNPMVHVKFLVEIDLTNSKVSLVPMQAFNRTNSSGHDSDFTRTPECEDDGVYCAGPTDEAGESQTNIFSDDEAPEEVKFVKEVTIGQPILETESKKVSEKDEVKEVPDKPLSPILLSAEPDDYNYDDPSSDEHESKEVEKAIVEEYDVIEEKEKPKDVKVAERAEEVEDHEDSEDSDLIVSELSRCSSCDEETSYYYRVTKLGCLDCVQSSEEYMTESEEEEEDDVYEIEELEVRIGDPGRHEVTESENASSEGGFDSKDQSQNKILASDISESCSCSKKRSYDEAELDAPEAESASTISTPLPKKRKRIAATVLKELGKGAFFVAGTLAALIAYGKSLENQ